MHQIVEIAVGIAHRRDRVYRVRRPIPLSNKSADVLVVPAQRVVAVRLVPWRSCRPGRSSGHAPIGAVRVRPGPGSRPLHKTAKCRPRRCQGSGNGAKAMAAHWRPFSCWAELRLMPGMADRWRRPLKGLRNIADTGFLVDVLSEIDFPVLTVELYGGSVDHRYRMISMASSDISAPFLGSTPKKLLISGDAARAETQIQPPARHVIQHRQAAGYMGRMVLLHAHRRRSHAESAWCRPGPGQ